jgi:voltage-gated potassium channel
METKKSSTKHDNDLTPLQNRIHEIIFEADTKAGKFFDVVLLVFIVVSVMITMIDSLTIHSVRINKWVYILEWVVTIGFTIEYFLRIYCVNRPVKYIFSFFGIIDLLSLIPTYLSIIFVESHYLAVIRILRLLRIFRVFKLAPYIKESNLLLIALRSSRRKISIFFFFMILLTTIMGSAMYVIEFGVNDKFSSIPESIYWAIVTITTVGYGDISPVTPMGKFLASFMMILGYAIIAVPTGIITANIAKEYRVENLTTQSCPHCTKEGHDIDAKHCKYCGGRL